MAKFKVGDRFKVVSNADDGQYDSYVGETGKITRIGKVNRYGQTYWVELDDYAGPTYFYESELEKLED